MKAVHFLALVIMGPPLLLGFIGALVTEKKQSTPAVVSTIDTKEAADREIMAKKAANQEIEVKEARRYCESLVPGMRQVRQIVPERHPVKRGRPWTVLAQVREGGLETGDWNPYKCQIYAETGEVLHVFIPGTLGWEWNDLGRDNSRD